LTDDLLGTESISSI